MRLPAATRMGQESEPRSVCCAADRGEQAVEVLATGVRTRADERRYPDVVAPLRRRRP